MLMLMEGEYLPSRNHEPWLGVTCYAVPDMRVQLNSTRRETGMSRVRRYVHTCRRARKHSQTTENLNLTFSCYLKLFTVKVRDK